MNHSSYSCFYLWFFWALHGHLWSAFHLWITFLTVERDTPILFFFFFAKTTWQPLQNLWATTIDSLRYLLMSFLFGIILRLWLWWSVHKVHLTMRGLCHGVDFLFLCWDFLCSPVLFFFVFVLLSRSCSVLDSVLGSSWSSVGLDFQTKTGNRAKHKAVVSFWFCFTVWPRLHLHNYGCVLVLLILSKIKWRLG